MSQQETKINKLLQSYGINTRLSKGRFKTALREVGRTLHRRLSDPEMEGFIDLYCKVINLDSRSVENIPLQTARGLGAVISRCIVDKAILRFISLASPAYIQDKQGRHIDIASGEDKQSYFYLPKIKAKLEMLFPENHYEVYLSDLDPELEASPDRLETLFSRNLVGLRSHFGPAQRLSTLINQLELNKTKMEIKDKSKLAAEIGSLQHRETVLSVHKITPEAVGERGLAYAALGVILERIIPNAVVLDVQTRIYPYEQPFYDVLRRFPLPLIRPIKF